MIQILSFGNCFTREISYFATNSSLIDFGVNIFISTENKKNPQGALIRTIKKLKTVVALECMAEQKLCQRLRFFSKNLLRFSDLYFNLSVIIKV